MKTPKRKHCDIYKCEKCGGYGITFTADDTTSALYQCTLCGTCWHMPGLPKRTRAFRARCTRKNREARLKNSLREKNRQIELEKIKTEGGIRARAVLRRLLFAEMKRAEKYRNTFRTSGAFGQDVEGS